MTFGERLALYRKKLNLTQRELAALVGMGVNTINNYERGLQSPYHREVYANLAEVLGVRVDDLICEEDDGSDHTRGKEEAMSLVEDIRGIFAGGTIQEEDRDEILIAMQELYWKAKFDHKRCPPKAHDPEED